MDECDVDDVVHSDPSSFELDVDFDLPLGPATADECDVWAIHQVNRVGTLDGEEQLSANVGKGTDLTKYMSGAGQAEQSCLTVDEACHALRLVPPGSAPCFRSRVACDTDRTCRLGLQSGTKPETVHLAFFKISSISSIQLR